MMMIILYHILRKFNWQRYHGMIFGLMATIIYSLLFKIVENTNHVSP
jgi:hypothetical protein